MKKKQFKFCITMSLTAIIVSTGMLMPWQKANANVNAYSVGSYSALGYSVGSEPIKQGFQQGDGYNKGDYDQASVQPTAFNWTRQSKLYGSPSGNIAWDFEADGPIISAPVIGKNGDVYFGCYDKFVYALDAVGDVKWSFPTNGPIIASPAIGGDGTLYIGSSEGQFYAIDKTGKQKWSITLRGCIYGSSAISNDGTIIVGTMENMLYALNPTDGTIKWTYENQERPGSFASTVAIDKQGTIYAGMTSGILCVLDLKGKLVGTVKLDSAICSSPVLTSDGGLVVMTNSSTVYSFDQEGKIRGQVQLSNAEGAQSGPVIAEDSDGNVTIYAGSFDGSLYATSITGDVKWQFKTGGPIISSPIVDRGGTVYFGSVDGSMYAVSSEGKLVWSYTCNSFIRSSPAIGEGGRVYFGSDDGKLYEVSAIGLPAMLPEDRVKPVAMVGTEPISQKEFKDMLNSYKKSELEKANVANTAAAKAAFWKKNYRSLDQAKKDILQNLYLEKVRIIRIKKENASGMDLAWTSQLRIIQQELVGDNPKDGVFEAAFQKKYGCTIAAARPIYMTMLADSLNKSDALDNSNGVRELYDKYFEPICLMWNDLYYNYIDQTNPVELEKHPSIIMHKFSIPLKNLKDVDNALDIMIEKELKLEDKALRKVFRELPPQLYSPFDDVKTYDTLDISLNQVDSGTQDEFMRIGIELLKQAGNSNTSLMESWSIYSSQFEKSTDSKMVKNLTMFYNKLDMKQSGLIIDTSTSKFVKTLLGCTSLYQDETTGCSIRLFNNHLYIIKPLKKLEVGTFDFHSALVQATNLQEFQLSLKRTIVDRLLEEDFKATTKTLDNKIYSSLK